MGDQQSVNLNQLDQEEFRECVHTVREKTFTWPVSSRIYAANRGSFWTFRVVTVKSRMRANVMGKQLPTT